MDAITFINHLSDYMNENFTFSKSTKIIIHLSNILLSCRSSLFDKNISQFIFLFQQSNVTSSFQFEDFYHRYFISEFLTFEKFAVYIYYMCKNLCD